MTQLINTPEPRIELLASELDSALWQKIKGHLVKRIEQLRKDNDADKSDTDTAKIRGQIKELKALLTLDK